MKVLDEEILFKEAVLNGKKKILTKEEINNIFNISDYTKETEVIFSRLKKK